MIETANHFQYAENGMEMAKALGRSLASLKDRDHRPLHSPRARTEEERGWSDECVGNMARICFWDTKELVSAVIHGATGCFKRTAYREEVPERKRRKRRNKPYQRAAYPGQKVQLDVKYVPSYCVVGEGSIISIRPKTKCSRWTYREMYSEHSTYSSKQFVVNLVERTVSDPGNPNRQRHRVYQGSTDS